jgi:hypothetical protein
LVRMVIILGHMPQHVASNVTLVGRLNSPRKRCADVGMIGALKKSLKRAF